MASVVARTLMAVGTLAALAAGPAHASNVGWSVGIQAPIGPGVSVGTVITNGFPVVAPVVAAPVYVPPPPVVMPAPVYAPPVVVAPPVFVPHVVYGPPVWVGGRWVRPPMHRPYPVAWYPGHDHRGPPARMPGREIRY